MSKIIKALGCILLLAAMVCPPALAGEPLDFTLTTADGHRLRLADFRGRVVVLDFFATWCRPCTNAMPKLISLQKRLGSQGLSVIGYSLDKKGSRVVRSYAMKHGLNFPVVMGTVSQARRLADVTQLPTTVVLDPQGRIIYRSDGMTSESVLSEAARPYLNSRAPSAPAAARVEPPQKHSQRLRRVWITPAYVAQGRMGFLVHVVAEVYDLAVEQGLWLALHLRPEARRGTGLSPLAGDKKLYQRIDDGNQQHYAMFVNCSQLPALPDGGVYRAWITLLGPGQEVLDRTGEFLVSSPRDTVCRAR